MTFFRLALNKHDLTEQQWRVIRILCQQGELESHQLAHQACILKPSMTGVLTRLERDGLVRRQNPAMISGELSSRSRSVVSNASFP